MDILRHDFTQYYNKKKNPEGEEEGKTADGPAAEESRL
jgi:hypothetical protein